MGMGMGMGMFAVCMHMHMVKQAQEGRRVHAHAHADQAHARAHAKPAQVGEWSGRESCPPGTPPPEKATCLPSYPASPSYRSYVVPL